jgi:hypothetical protein
MTDHRAHAVTAVEAAGLDPEALIERELPAGRPIFGVPVGESTTAWERARAVHGTTGLWPFLSYEDPDEWAQRTAFVGATLGMLRHALNYSPAEVVAELIADQQIGAHEQRWADAGLTAYRLGLFDVEETLLRMDDEPVPVPQPGYLGVGGLLDEPLWLCLVPAGGGYELAGLVNTPYAHYWRACEEHPWLTTVDHVGVLRSWHERYGAEVRFLSTESMVLAVSRPPTERVEIAEVAVEQYAYCDDLGQTVGETGQVARLQVPGDRWSFWWK